MQQLTQNLKDGTMQLLEVPFPALTSGTVLVRNHFSLISAGTEGKSVKDARLGYIAKARARKEEVKKVLQAVKTFGLKDTYRMVMNRLDAPSALGYSCAGEVIAVASDVRDFQVGDRVACGGSTANHAEVVMVPVNLCVKLDPNVSLEQAAYTTVGSIALQGIRQADLRLGENCVVIGLGLLGQITIQLLRAAGVRTIGIDIDERMVRLAETMGCDLALSRRLEQLEDIVSNFTGGHGTDAVIITAGTDSTDPVDLAGALCRKKGRVVVVGAVPTGFKRPNYFKKELELRMSCSYGPGRYDPEYEEQGLDYPYAWVRWTENRNMMAFVELLRSRRIDLEPLTTHRFDFNEAKNAYQLILDRAEPFVGVLLRYDTSRPLKTRIEFQERKKAGSEPGIGLVGAGSFGQNFLLPAMKGLGRMIHVSTARSNNARNIADKHGFVRCTGDASEVINDPEVNVLFIATRHDTHAALVLDGLKAGKDVFVEKPLCLHPDELTAIQAAYQQGQSRLMVGFNRRFAPMIKKIKRTLSSNAPVAIQYRINAGHVAADHWIHNPSVGGGRIVGEVCHFVDLCSFLAASQVTQVSAMTMADPANQQDTLSITLGFANGSVAGITYFSNGNKQLPKEYLEVYQSGNVSVMNDFRELSSFGKNSVSEKGVQDKGHKAEVRAFLEAVRNGQPSPIPASDVFNATAATFAILESIATKGQVVRLDQ
ncbi:bi-domain-containing oxidoreductase [Candidatus Pollutiaquabacter sp.]|uniref:bi-domain-containing oxidoreductase n=1 Tax=Candidatus Pollutiaquabacter sp. TaxID=3416354 RepID=UPI003C9A9696|nr:bi-domain-containing oxidoreductase [Bacteroidota bacterium]